MKLYQVDAFTHTAFSGNPAGVWVGETFPEDTVMQALAAEMNVSETAFVTVGNKPAAIRYFTPTCEVPLCGHATLASAHILHSLGLLTKDTAFTLQAQEQDITVTAQADGYTLTFPAYTLFPMDHPVTLESLVGSSVKEAFCSDNGWIVARLTDEQTLRKTRPDFPAIQEYGSAMLIAATALSTDPHYDFVVRVFCNPAYGIQEDPVTGAAQCILAPYWSEVLKKKHFRVRQLSPRGGEMKVKLLEDGVEIMGQAVTVFTVELQVPLISSS